MLSRFRAFAGKEITENLRTKRLFSMCAIFVFIAILSVITARFIADIMGALLAADGGDGLVIIMPDPVWHDSYAQLYSNITQMGLLAFIMLFMGAVLKEKSSGTIDLVMAKGLTPMTFVLSKFVVGAVFTLASLFVALLLTYVYTLVLFEYAGQFGNVLFGAVPLAAFMLMLLAITLMWSAIAKSTATSAVLGIGTFFGLLVFDLIPVVGRFTPGNLLEHGVPITMGYEVERLGGQVVVALAITAAALWVAAWVLRRREG